MKLSDLPTNRDVVADEVARDPEFRRQRERTALARAVALQLVQYRADHHLTQTALARRLGMHQPAIARLEAGDHNPSWETLQRLSKELGLEFHLRIDITPESTQLSA